MRASQLAGAVNMLHGHVVDIAYLGDLSVYKIRDQHGLIVKASVANKDRRASGLLQRGDEAWLTFAPDAGVLLEGLTDGSTCEFRPLVSPRRDRHSLCVADRLSCGAVSDRAADLAVANRTGAAAL